MHWCRLVVVLERCTIVHALETLELLRTLETTPNPKVPPGQDALMSAVQDLHICVDCTASGDGGGFIVCMVGDST